MSSKETCGPPYNGGKIKSDTFKVLVAASKLFLFILLIFNFKTIRVKADASQDGAVDSWVTCFLMMTFFVRVMSL